VIKILYYILAVFMCLCVCVCVYRHSVWITSLYAVLSDSVKEVTVSRRFGLHMLQRV